MSSLKSGVDHARTTESARLNRYVLTALFAAVGAAGGYLLMAIPNVEVVTLLMFAAGYALGLVHGLVAAVVTAILYFGLNPQGGMFPPMLAAQTAGLCAAPLAGFLFRKLDHRLFKSEITRVFALAVTAVVITIWYDLLTNIAFPIFTGMGINALVGFLIAGIPFSILHVVSNVVIFSVVGRPLITTVVRHGLVQSAC